MAAKPRSAKQIAALKKAQAASAAKRKAKKAAPAKKAPVVYGTDRNGNKINREQFNKLGRMGQLKANVPKHWKFGGKESDYDKPAEVGASAYTDKLKSQGVTDISAYLAKTAKQAVQSVKPHPVNRRSR